MYHALLANRYLTSRVIPLLAVAAVALCVALVIIVVSVMTGFLNMVKESGRKLMGDVVVSYAVSGIPHYPRLIERIEALPEAAAATPVIDTWGLLKMPYPEGPDKQTEQVQIWGIEPESFARVTGYEEALYWGKQIEDRAPFPESQRQALFAHLVRDRWPELLPQLSESQRIDLVRKTVALDTRQDPPSEEAVRETLESVNWPIIFDVVRFEEELLRSVLSEAQWNDFLATQPILSDPAALVRQGLTLRRGDRPGIALGMHVSEGNLRQEDGSYAPAFGHWWMPRFEVTLTTIPVHGGLGGDPESAILQVVNEFVSGVYLIDNQRVMIPIDLAQDLTHLDERPLVDTEDPAMPEIGIDPARATLVLVRARERVTPDRLRDAVEGAYRAFAEELRDDLMPPPSADFGINIKTWEQQQAAFIGPVEKEREIMRTLFSLVYIVCAGLVLAIFWAIVYEKTRDIGILRSVGASRFGISWIFLRYGMVVGALGAIFGLGLAYIIVGNINGIHNTLGHPPVAVPISVLGGALVALVFTAVRAFGARLLPVVLGALATVTLFALGGLALWLYLIGGVIVWSPEVYYFTTIPNQIDLNSAYITMVGAVAFSLLGAFIPAAKAADTDPVKALRYE